MIARASAIAGLAIVLSACKKPLPAHSGADRGLLVSSDPPSLLDKTCVPTGPELCFNATDDNCNGIIDEGCGIRTGLVQFMIAWNEPRADVDLRVTDPNGELVEVGRTAQSGLLKERDCPGRNGECRGQNYENVYLESGDPPRGEYRVRVRLEALNGENPPIVVSFGARVGQKTYGLSFPLDAPEAERELVFRL
jgi:hypothetical protein